LPDSGAIRRLGVRAESGQDVVLYAGYGDGARRWTATDGWSEKSSLPAVHDFAVIPDSSIVFAGSDNGVYRSLDNGRSWQAVTKSLEDQLIEVAIYSLATGLDGSGHWGLYAVGTDSSFVFKTTVDPQQEASLDPLAPRWETISCPCGTHQALFSVGVDPLNTQTIYVGNDRSRISLSLDGGASWNTAIVPVGQAREVYITDIVVAPNSTAVYAATGGDSAVYGSNGLLLRTDQGDWVAVTPPGFQPGRDYVQALTISPDELQILYVGGSNGLFKFESNTQTWAQVP
jgi:hypothetical protein